MRLEEGVAAATATPHLMECRVTALQVAIRILQEIPGIPRRAVSRAMAEAAIVTRLPETALDTHLPEAVMGIRHQAACQETTMEMQAEERQEIRTQRILRMCTTTITTVLLSRSGIHPLMGLQ